MAFCPVSPPWLTFLHKTLVPRAEASTVHVPKERPARQGCRVGISPFLHSQEPSVHHLQTRDDDVQSRSLGPSPGVPRPAVPAAGCSPRALLSRVRGAALCGSGEAATFPSHRQGQCSPGSSWGSMRRFWCFPEACGAEAAGLVFVYKYV